MNTTKVIQLLSLVRERFAQDCEIQSICNLASDMYNEGIYTYHELLKVRFFLMGEVSHRNPYKWWYNKQDHQNLLNILDAKIKSNEDFSKYFESL